MYKSGNTLLNADNMVQISRNPTRGRARDVGHQGVRGLYQRPARCRRSGQGDDGVRRSVVGHQVDAEDRPGAGAADSGLVGGGDGDRGGAPAVLRPRPRVREARLLGRGLAAAWRCSSSRHRSLPARSGFPSSLINMPIEGGLNYQTPILLLEQWWRTELRTTATHICQRPVVGRCSPRGLTSSSTRTSSWPRRSRNWSTSVVALVTAGLMTAEEARTVVLGPAPVRVGSRRAGRPRNATFGRGVPGAGERAARSTQTYRSDEFRTSNTIRAVSEPTEVRRPHRQFSDAAAGRGTRCPKKSSGASSQRN